MMNKRFVALGGAAAATAALAAGPAAAQGAAVAAGAKCVGGVQTLHVVGGHLVRTFPVVASGFPGGAPVGVEAGGAPVSDGTPPNARNLARGGRPPLFPRPPQTVTPPPP